MTNGVCFDPGTDRLLTQQLELIQSVYGCGCSFLYNKTKLFWLQHCTLIGEKKEKKMSIPWT